MKVGWVTIKGNAGTTYASVGWPGPGPELVSFTELGRKGRVQLVNYPKASKNKALAIHAARAAMPAAFGNPAVNGTRLLSAQTPKQGKDLAEDNSSRP